MKIKFTTYSLLLTFTNTLVRGLLFVVNTNNKCLSNKNKPDFLCFYKQQLFFFCFSWPMSLMNYLHRKFITTATTTTTKKHYFVCVVFYLIVVFPSFFVVLFFIFDIDSIRFCCCFFCIFICIFICFIYFHYYFLIYCWFCCHCHLNYYEHHRQPLPLKLFS